MRQRQTHTKLIITQIQDARNVWFYRRKMPKQARWTPSDIIEMVDLRSWLPGDRSEWPQKFKYISDSILKERVYSVEPRARGGKTSHADSS